MVELRLWTGQHGAAAYAHFVRRSRITSVQLKKTQSEALFEELCSNHQIPCREIPRGPLKTADYDVRFGTQPVVVEVKQIEPNEDDQNALAGFEETGRAQVRGEVGRRVRQEITDPR